MTGVAQAAIGVPVASAPQSATTGKRFFDAMGSPCFILCELVVSYCWLRLMHSPRPVAPRRRSDACCQELLFVACLRQRFLVVAAVEPEQVDRHLRGGPLSLFLLGKGHGWRKR